MLKWVYLFLFYIKYRLIIIYLYFFPVEKKLTLSDKYTNFFLIKQDKLLKSLETPEKYNVNITDIYYNIDKLK